MTNNYFEQRQLNDGYVDYKQPINSFNGDQEKINIPALRKYYKQHQAPKIEGVPTQAMGAPNPLIFMVNYFSFAVATMGIEIKKIYEEIAKTDPSIRRAAPLKPMNATLTVNSTQKENLKILYEYVNNPQNTIPNQTKARLDELIEMNKAKDEFLSLYNCLRLAGEGKHKIYLAYKDTEKNEEYGYYFLDKNKGNNKKDVFFDPDVFDLNRTEKVIDNFNRHFPNFESHINGNAVVVYTNTVSYLKQNGFGSSEEIKNTLMAFAKGEYIAPKIEVKKLPNPEKPNATPQLTQAAAPEPAYKNLEYQKRDNLFGKNCPELYEIEKYRTIEPNNLDNPLFNNKTLLECLGTLNDFVQLKHIDPNNKANQEKIQSAINLHEFLTYIQTDGATYQINNDIVEWNEKSLKFDYRSISNYLTELVTEAKKTPNGTNWNENLDKFYDRSLDPLCSYFQINKYSAYEFDEYLTRQIISENNEKTLCFSIDESKLKKEKLSDAEITKAKSEMLNYLKSSFEDCPYVEENSVYIKGDSLFIKNPPTEILAAYPDAQNLSKDNLLENAVSEILNAKKTDGQTNHFPNFEIKPNGSLNLGVGSLTNVHLGIIKTQLETILPEGASIKFSKGQAKLEGITPEFIANLNEIGSKLKPKTIA